MKYTWKEYKQSQKIVNTFEQERAELQRERYYRKYSYSGFAKSDEEYFNMLKIRIWLRREFLAQEYRTIKVMKKPEDYDFWMKNYIQGLKDEIFRLRLEYYYIKKR